TVGALDILRRAVEAEQHCPLPLERARTRLALGRALRRAKRRADARLELEGALQRFEALGATRWTEQTRAELGRLGGRRRTDGLTPSEQKVAELAANGLPNKEIAAALFVTVHTVEAALTGIYQKLGVRSRTEMARKLAE